MPPSPAFPPSPPHPPNSPFPHCDLQSCVLGRFVGGGVWPHFLHSSTHLPPPHGCTPPMPSLWTEGLRPTPRPTLTALLRAPFTPQPFAHPPPNPSFLPPTPTAAFKTNPPPLPPPNPLLFLLCYLEMFTPSAQHPPPPPQPAAPTDGSAAADVWPLPLGAARCQRVRPGPAWGAQTAAGVAIGWCRAFCP